MSFRMSVKEIVEVTGGKLLCGDAKTVIEHISIDSRKSEGNDLFVPIIGAKVDAHRFIEGAFTAGCAATLTSKHREALDPSHAWIAVHDTIEALHAIGNYARANAPIPAIGVTGSVGKTTTREMISCALSAEKRVFRSIKNYNTTITVPIMMTMLDPAFDLAVLELGMNVPGELGEIARIAKPAMGVITNIGVAHMEFYGSKEAICKEKLSITAGMPEDGLLLLNGDDPLLYENRESTGHPYRLYGTKDGCDYRAENPENHGGCYSFDFCFGDRRVPVRLHALGRHNVLNATAALAAADLWGVDVAKAAEALASFTGFKNRLQTIPVGDKLIIDDTYNASPDSMAAGVEVLAGLDAEGRRIAVLSEMLELGQETPALHKGVGSRIAGLPIDELVVIGGMAGNIADGAEENGCAYSVKRLFDKREAMEYLAKTTGAGDVIYLKASNLVGLKDITAYLQAQEG